MKPYERSEMPSATNVAIASAKSKPMATAVATIQGSKVATKKPSKTCRSVLGPKAFCSLFPAS